MEEAAMIKIKLTAEDVSKGRYYLNLGKEPAVKECIFKNWTPMIIGRAAIDSIPVAMKDLDTDTEHEVRFRYYKQLDSHFLGGPWRENFIERRGLKVDDEIGITCNAESPNKLCFRLLNRKEDDDS